MTTKIRLKKQIVGLMLFLMILLFNAPLMVRAENEALSEDIVILYTNDVHTYIDGPLSYDLIAAIKDDLQREYKYVLLADAGDHVQGTAYGSMDKGESIIQMMNAADYDVATLGNHEFDYNMQGCMNVIDWAEFPYISCNFYRIANGVRGENVLDSYVMFDCGEEKIAFVGISTPETISKTTPAYFQDENGNFIYGFSGGENAYDLQRDVQNTIDNAEAAGATHVIALGHLGVDPSSAPWTSEETIAGVSGLDAFIDGHSHTVMESRTVRDKDGKDVLLTQTGEYFERIGMMVIDYESGDITADFIECTGNEEEGYTLTSDLYSGTVLLSDTTVETMKDSWLQEIDDRLGQNIGFATVTFDNYDSNGNRLVRGQETNSGDLAADSLYYLFDDMGLDVDIAIMNGGGVRNQATSGNISYKTCKEILPFGNVACLQTVTGQQILDMLEWGARHVGASEDGSFLHVSGITYKINTSIENTTQADNMDVWVGGPVKYRVHDVKVYNKSTGKWEALDLNAEYNLAGYNYTLRDLGGGFAMLNGAVNVLDYVMEDYMVLANYISGFENGNVQANNSPLLAKYPGLLIDYSDVNGSGRIEIVTEEVQDNTTLWVGGMKVTEANAADVFSDGKVSYDMESNTLTLNGWSYEGDGYHYGSYEDEESGEKEFYSAVIYSESSITIKLEGNNMLINSYDDMDKEQYGDGVVVEGSVFVMGDGSLHVSGSYGINADEMVTIDGCTISMETTNDAIISNDGDVIINNANIYIAAKADGIYARKDAKVTDSNITIVAGEDGIYSYDGSVTIDSTKVGISAYGPWVNGTKVSIEASGEYGIFAYKDLTVDKKLTISAPTGGRVEELSEDDYVYSTVVVGGNVSKNIVFEPLGYNVSIIGLMNNMVALVPVDQSLNEAYCEMYEVEDFSEILDTEKDGYIFGGWYTDESCTAGNEFNFDSPVTTDITIYAKWIPLYSIVVEKSEGGDVIVSAEAATKDENVLITLSPKDGKEVDNVTVIDKEGKLVAITQNEDGTYFYIQPESEVTIRVTFKDKQTGVTGTNDEDAVKDDSKPLEGTNSISDAKSPQTGDNGNPALWIVMLCISGVLVSGVSFGRRLRNESV